MSRPRPVLHFAPARGWMNDPDGLVQWNGRLHLFYQHNPAAPVHDSIAWGHADGGILEVFSPAAPAVAVICRRGGAHGRLDVDVSSRQGTPRGRARVTAWSCG
jgi:beta-fructofuranosidase